MLLPSEKPVKITRMGLAVSGINGWLLPRDMLKRFAESETEHDYWAKFLSVNTEKSRARVRRLLDLGRARDASALQKAIKVYRLSPSLSFDSSGRLGIEFWQETGPDRKCRFPEGEAYAVAGIIYLAHIGQLELLQICKVCEHLFQPSRGGQVNCSTHCSKRAYAMSEPEKQRRAAAQRAKYDRLFRATAKKP